jgi:hypothetical protein
MRAAATEQHNRRVIVILSSHEQETHPSDLGRAMKGTCLVMGIALNRRISLCYSKKAQLMPFQKAIPHLLPPSLLLHAPPFSNDRTAAPERRNSIHNKIGNTKVVAAAREHHPLSGWEVLDHCQWWLSCTTNDPMKPRQNSQILSESISSI